jgi:hypothetical protein
MATLQCVMLRDAPVDLRQMSGSTGIGTATVVSFTPDDEKVYRAASPIGHLSRSSASTTASWTIP